MHPTDVAAVAGDTTDPLAGLRAVAALRRLVETLEVRQVEAAVAAGATWQQVALELGVSRQAVHKKHAWRLRAATTTRGKD